MRVMLLCRALLVGGADRHIVELAHGLSRRGHQVTVVTFYDDNPLGAGLAAAGVELKSLRKRKRWDVLGFLWRLAVALRRRPDVLYSFLPVVNLTALLARLVAPNTMMVWGVMSSRVYLDRSDLLTRLSYDLERRLARCADLVIANSRAGADYAISRGFPAATMRVVPSGVDVDRFRPDPESRRKLRDAWGIDGRERLAGLVSRLNPEKGIPLFLDAVAIATKEDGNLRFAVIGSGPAAYRNELLDQTRQLGITDRVLWLPARNDIEAAYNALDLLVLSSPGEGLPLVVIEAMACGVPCVVTDVGDAREVVGDYGIVVPPGDAAALADGICAMQERVAAGGEKLAKATRRSIVDRFTTVMLAERTEKQLLALLDRPG